LAGRRVDDVRDWLVARAGRRHQRHQHWQDNSSLPHHSRIRPGSEVHAALMLDMVNKSSPQRRRVSGKKHGSSSEGKNPAGEGAGFRFETLKAAVLAASKIATDGCSRRCLVPLAFQDHRPECKADSKRCYDAEQGNPHGTNLLVCSTARGKSETGNADGGASVPARR
jgi:hypothetical protein